MSVKARSIVLASLCLIPYAGSAKKPHKPVAVQPKSQAKTSKDKVEDKPEVDFAMQAVGDFTAFTTGDGPKKSACTGFNAKLYKADGSAVKATPAPTLNADASVVIITYQAKIGDDPPTIALLGCTQILTGQPYKLTTLDPDVVTQHVTLTGDYAGLLGTSVSDNCDPKSTSITGYVSGGDASSTRKVTVQCLQKNLVDLTFTAGSSFHPTSLVLQHSPFPYTLAAPIVSQDAVYLATGIADLCIADPPQPPAVAPPGPSCSDLSLTPAFPSVVDGITLRSVEGEHLFAAVRTRDANLPAVINLQDKKSGKTLLARLVTRPDSEQSLLSVDLNVMDQETARRNYGARIAEHYIAVNLDLANRSDKKLQFNKSAIWFDVDYLEASGKYRLSFHNKLAHLTLDAVPYEVYDSPLATAGCYDIQANGDHSNWRDCKYYRYGIDQNQRVFPDSYQAMLNSFDYVTERSDRLLSYFELFGSVLTTISTGGIIAQVHNSAFRDAISVLTATFLPGFRSISMDTAHVDRLRANLVNTTFQDTVLLPPRGHTSTTVLLSREGKLDMEGYETPVVIDRVLNVHIDPDVLNGVKDAAVPQGKVQIGYTRDQVRQAIGEPDKSETARDGTTTFTYSEGPYSEVKFDKQGHVTAFTTRNVLQEVKAAATLADAQKVLSSHGITAKTLTLLNSNSILTGIPDEGNTVPLFSNNGKQIATGYTLLNNEISKLVGKTQSELEVELGKLKLPDPVKTYSPTSTEKFVVTYPMPDIKGGTLLATFDKSPKDKSAKIAKIDYGGDKP